MDLRESGALCAPLSQVGVASREPRAGRPDRRAGGPRPACVLAAIFAASVALVIVGYVCYTDGCSLLGA